MNLQKLQSQRGGTKKIIERFIEKLAEAKNNDDMIEFEATLETLQEKVEILQSLNEKILSQTDTDATEDEMIQSEEYSLDLEIKLRKFRHYVKQRSSQIEKETQESETQLRGNQRIDENPSDHSRQPPPFPLSFPSASISNSSQFSRLPKLTLPKFDGDLLQWQSFWDSFDSAIHSNINLSDVQKFGYLKAQLEGTAAMTVEGFALTNANYVRALELLRERYGQQSKIVHATMQALLNLPTPTSSVSSLRQFYHRMETYIRGLESLGQSQDMYGSLLVPIVIDKLPTDMRKNLARVNENNDWKLEDLRRAINKEINILETGSLNPRPDVDAHNPTALFYAGTKGKHSSKSRVSNSSDQYKHTVKCAFCHRSHHSNECKTFPDMDARLTVVKQEQLCFNCLGKHQLSRCKSRRTCRFCNKRHNSSICSKNTVFHRDQPTGLDQSSRPEAAILYADAGDTRPDVLLKTAVAEVGYDHYTTSAKILFDEGAQRTFITEKLANDLHLPRTGTDVIRVASFGSQQHDVRHMDKADIYLKTDYGRDIKMHVLIVPTIAVPFNNRIQRQAATLPYLQGLKLAHPVIPDDVFEISLLIGADYYWQIVQDKVIRGNGPTAVKSRIGYLLSGPVNQYTMPAQADYIMNVVTAPHTADDIDRFWKLESLGISADESDESEICTMKEYQQTHISFEDGKYKARLPWKPDHDHLPTNYEITKRRTQSTISRLSRDPNILKKYSDIIADQEKRGFIEKVSEVETQANDRQIHYIPHHPVKKDSDTTPVRIVYDCSCRQSKEIPSLNDCLQSNPPALNDLTTLLVKFRLHEFAVSTDIEKAFLHVSLHECDRDVTRFLWLSDPSDIHSSLQTYRFKAVLFGATCSPFILNATLQKHLDENSEKWVSQTMKDDLYVDNIISSFPQEDTVLQYFRDARDLMLNAGFNLRAWTSNSDKLKRLADSENVLDRKQCTKILGMTWNTPTDDIGFPGNPVIVTPQNMTKREILRQTSKSYDPLGLLTPVTVRAKILIQDIWRQNFNWDTILPDGIQRTWNSIVQDLNEAMKKRVARYYFRKSAPDDNSANNASPTLHVFVDSSMMSYGAAAYIVKGNQSTLVMAKNRVAPLKSITLPKLELMAAVVGARLSAHLQTALDCKSVFLWSDSQIVLHWLRENRTKPLQRFVKNRIAEIHKLTGSYQWSYCPTYQNPADLLTRGISAKQHAESSLWWNGPTWIADENQWPKWSSNLEGPASALLTTTDDQQMLLEPGSSSTDTETGIHKIIDIKRYSQYKKLLRVTAYLLRFIESCRKPEVRTQRWHASLTVDEIQKAEHLWLQNCQQESYANEIHNLRTGTSRRLTAVKQLRLFLDKDGFLRCGGRIHNAPLSEMTKFPVLLPTKHYLTKLIVTDAHCEIQHSGTSATITLLRQRYWIPKIRQCVKSVIWKCVTCRKVQGKPFSAPDPPPLMKYRVHDCPPFSVTGVDYTGALYVKDPTGSETKVYICLFTCASTRAVHLELVQDLTADAFIQAFRRFVSRKSLPYLMVSDNSTTFISASTHLQQLSESVHDELANRGTKWEFIPKRAPWFGGFWERLIGLTKSALKKVLGRAYITFAILQTILTEIEATLNDRPLTYVGTECDLTEVITPAHLLYGRRVKTLPYRDIARGNLEMTNTTGNDIRKRAKVQQTIIEHFRDRWRKEYLTSLREHHTASGKNNQNITVGSVVQVHDETPRSSWRLAVVEEVVRGNDGLIRSAKIRSGNKLTNRPITKLYPLEVNANN